MFHFRLPLRCQAGDPARTTKWPEVIFDASLEGIGEYPGPITKSHPETDKKDEEEVEADAIGEFPT